MSEQEIVTINSGVPAAITPAEMLSIAVQQGAELDKLEKLMELQERWEKNEAKKAYTNAMSKFRSECPTILKTKDGHNSKYAGLAETIGQIKGLLAKNGLSHSWRTEQGNNMIAVTCCITHSQGHSECTSLSAGADSSGSKNSIQAIGSTVTYLERYTLVAILGLASSDQDDDGKASSSGGMFVSDEKSILDALLITRDALGVYLLADSIGQDLYINIYNSYPEGMRMSVKRTIDDLHSIGLDILNNIETGLDSGDNFLVLENIEGMSNYTKRLLKAKIGEEKISAIAKMKKESS